jgi:hypothetical protein
MNTTLRDKAEELAEPAGKRAASGCLFVVVLGLLAFWLVGEVRFSLVAVRTTGTVKRWKPRTSLGGHLFGEGVAEVGVRHEGVPPHRDVMTYWWYEPDVGDELPVLVDPRSASPGCVDGFWQHHFTRFIPAVLLLACLMPTLWGWLNRRRKTRSAPKQDP